MNWRTHWCWFVFLICLGASDRARAQLDPEKRRLFQFGYDQPLQGRGPLSGYAFYYYNEPGFIRTNAATERQWDSYGPDGQRALVDRIAMKRLGTAEDIASAAVFFASDLAGFVNGQILSVDGGR